MLIRMNSLIYLSVVLFIIFVVGCSDSGRSPEAPAPDEQTTNISGTVSAASTGGTRFSGLRTIFTPATDHCSRIENTIGSAGAITDEKIEVSAGGKSVLTDANGFYRLENVPVPEDGRLVITFTHIDGLFS